MKDLGVYGCWCASRSSKPLSAVKNCPGGFDSHMFPPKALQSLQRFFVFMERQMRFVENSGSYLILTNNPLVAARLKDEFFVDYRAECTGREILIAVRDAVYMGHTLYTHPLAGSVKPGETPYKSVVISCVPRKFEVSRAEMIANAIITFDGVKQQNRILSEKILRDFQLIDYALLCSGIGVDAAASFGQRMNKGGACFEIGVRFYSNQ